MGQAIVDTRPAILIVEDEALIRHDLLDFFEDAGLAVFEAENADDAIELLARHLELRIVLTDVDMPGSMDGVRLAHFIRERYPPTFLLINSGVAKLRSDDLPIGAMFVPKRFDPHALLTMIKSRDSSVG